MVESVLHAVLPHHGVVPGLLALLLPRAGQDTQQFLLAVTASERVK